MKKFMMFLSVVVIASVMLGCTVTPAGTITSSYENDEFIFTKILMPDDREVWVAKSKAKGNKVVSTNEEHKEGKVRKYNCVIVIDENGNEHITDKKLVTK